MDAPSTSHHHHTNNHVGNTFDDDGAPSYSEAFPPLPEQQQPQRQTTIKAPQRATTSKAKVPQQQQVKQQTQRPTTMVRSVAPSRKTYSIHIPAEERKYRVADEATMPAATAGRRSRGAQRDTEESVCGQIIKNTGEFLLSENPLFAIRKEMCFSSRKYFFIAGVEIEMYPTKEGGLRLFITGREDEIALARVEVMQRLHTHATVTLSIPKEHHRMLLGKRGERLSGIELATGTKIQVPPQNDPSSEIRISGTRDGLQLASHQLQVISDEQVSALKKNKNAEKFRVKTYVEKNV